MGSIKGARRSIEVGGAPRGLLQLGASRELESHVVLYAPFSMLLAPEMFPRRRAPDMVVTTDAFVNSGHAAQRSAKGARS